MIKVLNKLIVPIIIIIVGTIIYFILKMMVNKIFARYQNKYTNNRYNTLLSLIKNVVKYFIIIVCLTMILDYFGVDTKSIVTSLGIVGVVTGLALQDFLKDLVAGISIVLENQYAIGDIVTIDNFKGTVTSFSLKTTRIKSWTGEEKIIANHLISSVLNHTHNNSLAIVDVNVAYEADIDQVEKVLKNLCKKLETNIENLEGNIEVLGIEELASSSIVFRIIAEVKSGEQFNVQREIRKYVKKELDKNNISIPYNQLVIHNE